MAFIRSDRLNTMWTAFAKWFANMWTAFAKWFASAIRHLVAVLKKQPTKNLPVTENWFAAMYTICDRCLRACGFPFCLPHIAVRENDLDFLRKRELREGAHVKKSYASYQLR